MGRPLRDHFPVAQDSRNLKGKRGRSDCAIGHSFALGSDAARLRRLAFRDALAPVAAGLASGIIGALWLTRFIGSLLYRARPYDPATCAAVVLVLPRRRRNCGLHPGAPGTRVAPLEALRVS